MAMWTPVGKASLVDCAMFTWLFGLMALYDPFGAPRSSSARLASTSFVFMLIDVPAPPWIGSTRNWSWSFPAITSSAAAEMASAIFASRCPVSRLARAAAFLTIAIARMSAGWIRYPVMGKFSIARKVCTP